MSAFPFLSLVLFEHRGAACIQLLLFGLMEERENGCEILCNSVPRSVEVVETVYTFSQLPSKAIDQTRAHSASSVRQLQHPALIAEKLSKRKWCQSKILMHVTVNNPEMSSCNLRKWLLSCFLAFCSTGTITLLCKTDEVLLCDL